MDIVERLRKMVGVYIGDADIDDDLNNAADEIERLREVLKEIEYLDRPQIRGLPRRVTIQEIALAALQQNEAQILATNTYEAEGRN